MTDVNSGFRCPKCGGTNVIYVETAKHVYDIASSYHGYFIVEYADSEEDGKGEVRCLDCHYVEVPVNVQYGY